MLAHAFAGSEYRKISLFGGTYVRSISLAQLGIALMIVYRWGYSQCVVQVTPKAAAVAYNGGVLRNTFLHLLAAGTWDRSKGASATSGDGHNVDFVFAHASYFNWQLGNPVKRRGNDDPQLYVEYGVLNDSSSNVRTAWTQPSAVSVNPYFQIHAHNSTQPEEDERDEINQGLQDRDLDFHLLKRAVTCGPARDDEIIDQYMDCTCLPSGTRVQVVCSGYSEGASNPKLTWSWWDQIRNNLFAAVGTSIRTGAMNYGISISSGSYHPGGTVFTTQRGGNTWQGSTMSNDDNSCCHQAMSQVSSKLGGFARPPPQCTCENRQKSWLLTVHSLS